MSSWRRSLRVLLVIVFLHATTVSTWRWYAGSALLTPVVLSVPDVLLGQDEPLAMTAAVFNVHSGVPQQRVPLRFVVLGNTVEGAEQLASTDATGQASAVLKLNPDSIHGSQPGASAVEVELGVSIIPGSRWLLTGHSYRPGVGPRVVAATVLVLRPGTSILLVDFGTAQAGSFALSSEARTAIAEASRLQARTIHVLRAQERWRDEIRRELDSVGLQDGLLFLLGTDSRHDDRLVDLSERLKALEAKVEAILCAGSDKPSYERIFPQANITRLEE